MLPIMHAVITLIACIALAKLCLVCISTQKLTQAWAEIGDLLFLISVMP